MSQEVFKCRKGHCISQHVESDCVHAVHVQLRIRLRQSNGIDLELKISIDFQRQLHCLEAASLLPLCANKYAERAFGGTNANQML